MKKKKLFLGFAIAAAAVLGLASCGNDDATTTTTGAPTAQPTVQPTGSVPGSSTTTTQAWTPRVGANEIKMNGVKYETITAALAAIPKDSKDTFEIVLGKGTYTENTLRYDGSATVKFSGDTQEKYGADVIIKGRGSNMAAMKTRELLYITGTANVVLENITLESDYSRAESGKDSQAEVFATEGAVKSAAYNCSFLSHQDTLRTAGKAWFYGCYVEGDTDFLWMEQAGTVALYEKCEIVSVYDKDASTHASYLTAPRMAVSTKAGKGLVIYNSEVKETSEAKRGGQLTYLARTPWSSGYYNQVAYINTKCTDVEVEPNADSKSADAPWYGTQIATDLPKTVIGWKMDKATATSLGVAATKDYILDDAVTTKEFNGRKAIVNRVYNISKGAYEQDLDVWDVDAIVTANNWTVDADASKSLLDGEVIGKTTTYLFDGSVDQSALCNNFALQSGKTHYVGNNGATITIPVSGKSIVEVYGYYQGTAEAKAGSQGEAVMFFNNNSTGSTVENDYVISDASATSFVLTAKGTTYITKIVVNEDATVTNKPVTSLDISASTKNECVGVALTLTGKVNGDASNKSLKWTSDNTAVGDINEYTGKVTFKSEGTVTFTATARDGSGVTKSITCNPINPKWVSAEWYTTDTALADEAGATEIGTFGVNDSANKSIGTSYTFKNINGDDVTTSYGLKLNGSGKLTISTTKPNCTLTLVLVNNVNKKEAPKVTDGTTVLEAVSAVDDGNLTTYTYRLATAGTWDITRAGSSEINPILYARADYDTKINEATMFNFKHGGISAPAGVTEVNVNDGVDYSFDGSKVTVNCMTFEGVKSNGANNWGKYTTGATMSFESDKAGVLTISFYSGNEDATVTNNGATVAATKNGEKADYTTTYTYNLAAGKNVITFTGGQYLGYVTFVPAE